MCSVSCSFSYCRAGRSLADGGIQKKKNWAHRYREQAGLPEVGEMGEGDRSEGVKFQLQTSPGDRVRCGNYKLTRLGYVCGSY